MFSIFILYLFSQACSRSELAMNWADGFITNYIDQYFDMNSLQLQLLEKSLDEDLLKVRKIVFPQLADKLQKINLDIEGRILFNESLVSSYATDFKGIFKSGLIIFEPSAENFVNQLSASQVQSFKNKFDKKTKELEKVAGNILGARKKRYDNLKTQLESWIGTLDSDQKADIEKYADANPFPLEEQILNRNKLAAEFVKVFPDKNKRTKFIHELFYNYESLRAPQYAKLMDEGRHKDFEIIAVILNKMTSYQKKTLARKLFDRAEQVKKMAKNTKSDLF